MMIARADDFVGRHLIVDASTYNRRNLTSTDTIFSLFEAMARNLDMTLVIPPIAEPHAARAGLRFPALVLPYSNAW